MNVKAYIRNQNGKTVIVSKHQKTTRKSYPNIITSATNAMNDFMFNQNDSHKKLRLTMGKICLVALLIIAVMPAQVKQAKEYAVNLYIEYQDNLPVKLVSAYIGPATVHAESNSNSSSKAEPKEVTTKDRYDECIEKGGVPGVLDSGFQCATPAK